MPHFSSQRQPYVHHGAFPDAPSAPSKQPSRTDTALGSHSISELMPLCGIYWFTYYLPAGGGNIYKQVHY